MKMMLSELESLLDKGVSVGISCEYGIIPIDQTNSISFTCCNDTIIGSLVDETTVTLFDLLVNTSEFDINTTNFILL